MEHYGYTSEEFSSMTIKDIRPAEDIPALLNDIELTTNIYNQAGEWRHLKKNGEVIFVEIISHSEIFNGKIARHVLINDITFRKQAELSLRQSEEKFRLIAEMQKNLPVIAITAFAMSGDKKKILEAGCDDFLSKPVNKEVLLGKLRKYGINHGA